MYKRHSNGTFAAGNAGGPGNPYNRRVAALRSALLAAVSEEDLREIVVTLVQGAKRGDMAALKLLLAYTIGRPTDAPNPDRVDLEGAELEEERRYTIL